MATVSANKSPGKDTDFTVLDNVLGQVVKYLLLVNVSFKFKMVRRFTILMKG